MVVNQFLTCGNVARGMFMIFIIKTGCDEVMLTFHHLALLLILRHMEQVEGKESQVPQVLWCEELQGVCWYTLQVVLPVWFV